MHDPAAIFRFHEHDLFVPMAVLEELDNHKKGVSEVARNVRQVSRYLDDLMRAAAVDNIQEGIQLASLNGPRQQQYRPMGNLFFQTKANTKHLPADLPGNKTDNTILETVLSIIADEPDRAVTLLSKDINLRIKANVLGIDTEDYYEDQVLEDLELLYSGIFELPDDFWQTHGKDMRSWQDKGNTYYAVNGPLAEKWYANQCLYSNAGDGFEAMARTGDAGEVIMQMAVDFRSVNHSVWGICARNREQNFALNLLMDPDVDFVTLVGMAGTGKTLLTLAAGLTQTIEKNLYREIIMTRVTVPLGEDIGFLPGTEEEKMTPWMGALMDNLEVLAKPGSGGNWGQAATVDLLSHRIKIRSTNFMRGRTFLNKFVIIDEAQNLTAKQMRALVTRAGPGSKIVCLGNIAQIDTPYLSETTSGLTYVVDRFKQWEHSGHVTLTRGERSRLADFAAEAL